VRLRSERTRSARGIGASRGLAAVIGCLAALLAAGMLPDRALAGRGLFIGIDDDGLKWGADPSPFLAAYRGLGVEADRGTGGGQPGQRVGASSDQPALDRVAAVAGSVRVVLVVGGGRGAQPPLTAAARTAYCTYVSSLLHDYPTIHDVVIWNEANQTTFWQSPNPAAYERLLATCWDVLHSAVPGVNVIATTGPHARIRGAIAPAAWYAGVGRTLRASGRKRPIFDTLGHNVYPDSPFERPTTKHKGTSIDQGDYGKLMAVLKQAFGRTAQPLPGTKGVS